MKFGLDTRDKLLLAIRKTYGEFLALEKARAFKFGHSKLSQILRELNNQNQLKLGLPHSITISVNNQPIHIQIKLELDDGKQQRITITRTPKENFSITDLKIRATNAFDHNDPEDVAHIIDLLSLKPLIYDYKKGVVNYEQPVLRTTINNQEFKLGGPEKLDLYNEHLNVLVTLFGYLQNNDLQALKTTLAQKTQGSGKTFLQALWFFVLNHAQLSAVFALPGNLTKQFLKDFKKILPAELVEQIKVIDKNPRKCEQAIKALSALAETKDAQYFIGSYKVLLDQYYDQLQSLSGDNVFISFDEQHKVVKQERRKLRMLELSKKLWAMYLTATADEKTSSDCKVVASMSRKAKKDAGQGDFSNVHVVRAKKINTLRKQSAYRHKKGFTLKVANQFVEEPSSAATALLTDLPFMVESKEICKSDEQLLRDRWNKVPVLSRKALVCVGDSIDDLINVDNFTNPHKSSTKQSQNVAEEKLLTNLYGDGNKRDRGPAYGLLLQSKNLDKAIVKSFLEKKRDQFTNKHGTSLAAPRPLPETLNNTVFHGIVENMVRAILAFDDQNPKQSLNEFQAIDSIKLNEMRLNDLDGLVKKVRSKLSAMNRTKLDLKQYFTGLLLYDKTNNPKGIDPTGAQDVAKIMADLIVTIDDYYSVDLQTVVDNSGVDFSIYDIYKKRDAARSNSFNKFAKKFRTLYMIKGMSKSEVTINPDQPFTGFTEERYPLFEKDGTMTIRAKRRKHTAVETLDDRTFEYRYTPEYTDFSEEIADNYCMLGLTAMYISDAKSTGFNDANLQTTIQLVPNSGDNNNRAPEIIQTMTRNRGFDPTQIPSFIQILNTDVDVFFDANLPQKKEHYDREYHRAERRYRVKFIEKLAKQVAKDIRDWIYDNLDVFDFVDEELLALHVDKFIAQNLRRLNNNNGHDIQLSIKQYHKVLKLFQKELSNEIENTEKPFELSLFVRITAAIINFFVRVFRFFSNITTRIRLARARKLLATKDSTDPAVKQQQMYSKVLKTHNLSSMRHLAFVTKEFRLLFDREKVVIERQFEETKEDLLITEDKNVIADFLLSAVRMFYQPSDQTLIESAIKLVPSWTDLVMQQEEKMIALKSSATDQGKLKALKEFVQLIVRRLPFVDGKPLPAMQQYDEYINRSVVQFLKSDVLAELKQFLPAYSYQLVHSILLETKYPDQGENALRLVRHLTQHSSKIDTPDSILSEFSALFLADYPDVINVESEKRIAQEAQKYIEVIQNDINNIFTKHISMPDETDSTLMSWWGQAKAAASYMMLDRNVLIADLSAYLQGGFLTNAKYALPEQECDVLHSILSQKKRADGFANYLVDKADELKKLNSQQDILGVLVGYLKGCFKHPSFQPLLDKLRTTSEITKQSDISKAQILDRSRDTVEENVRAELEPLLECKKKLEALFGDDNKFKQHANQIAKKHLIEIMRHPELVKLNKILLNKLTQDDIIGLLNAYEDNHFSEDAFSNTVDVAAQIFQFISSIEQNNQNVLDQFDMSQFPDIQLGLKRIADQITNWLCQFEQTDRRGVPTKSNDPQDVNDIRTIKRYQNPDHGPSHIASKFSYMQSIREALPDASKVSAYTNRGRIKILSSVKSSLVDPLIKAWRKSKNSIDSAIKKLDAQQDNQATQTLSTNSEKLQTSYQRHALLLTKRLREAQPLKVDQADQNGKEYKDAVAETITHLDALIAARTAEITFGSPLHAGQQEAKKAEVIPIKAENNTLVV